MKITFDVKNQILSRTDRQYVIANSTDYLEAEITFSEDWADLEKNMQFVSGDNKYTFALEQDGAVWKIAQNQHLNLGIGTWKASIIGVGGDKRIVTNEANVAIRASGWIGVGGPIPSVYEQLLTIIQSLHTEVASSAVIRSAVQQYIVDNFDALVKEVVVVGDVQEIIDDMVEDGTISALLDQVIAGDVPGAVTDWLEDHVDPDTGYVIDNTLTTALAAADAKATGDAITNLNSALTQTNTAIKSTWKVTGYAYTINKGQRLNESTGITESYSLACRTGTSSGLGYMAAYELPSDTYEYEAFYYGTNGSVSTGADYIGHGSYKNALEYVPTNAIKVAFTFKRKDSGTITDSDIAAIRSAFVIYRATDRNLENVGVPADAKTVGDRFVELNTNLQNYGVYKINSLTTGWKDSKYARLGGVSIGSKVETRDSENYECLQVGCSEGDVFIVTCDGAFGYVRAYGFSDENNEIFANSNVSPASTSYDNTLLVAPQGASWLWITRLKTHIGTNAKLLTIKNRVDGLQPQSGMKVVNFGDSIFGNFRATSGVNKSISNMLKEMTNATYSNAAIGGTHSGDSDNAQGEAIQTNTPLYDFTALVTAIISGDFTAQYADGSHDDVMNILSAIDFSTIDIITVSYGTNDWSYGTSITKYKANLVDGITRMLTAYPNLRVILCTPIIRFKSEGGVIYDSDSDQMKNGKNKKVPDYATAVEELCRQHHFICCDNYWTLGINTYNRAKFFGSSEMVHPNATGRKVIADQLASIINKA